MTTRKRTPAAARRVERASGRLATAATERMAEELPWFRDLPAEDRSWVGVVAQAGIAGFVRWLREPVNLDVVGAVFGAAPRELARSVSLQHAVELVRVTVDTVERHVDELAPPGEAVALREAVLRYSREVAFAAARVYAAAAEERAAWHARLRALLIEAVVRDDPPDVLDARAAALGWTGPGAVLVVAGYAPPGDAEVVLEEAERTCRTAGLETLSGLHGDRLVVVVRGAGARMTELAAACSAYGDGPVVVGPTVPDVRAAPRSARAALAGLRAAVAWPDAPRPVEAADLLAERLLAGDETAGAELVEDFYNPLAAGDGALLTTVAAYVESGSSIEATARALYLHPNTVRYRLRKATELTGVAVTEPRGQFHARVALVAGRLATPPEHRSYL